MKNKLCVSLSILLCAVLIFLFSGCGKNNEKDTSSAIDISNAESEILTEPSSDSPEDTVTSEESDEQTTASDTSQESKTTTSENAQASNQQQTTKKETTPSETQKKISDNVTSNVESIAPVAPTENKKTVYEENKDNNANKTTIVEQPKVDTVKGDAQVEVKAPEITVTPEVKTSHTTISKNQYYQYNTLNQNDKAIYDCMYNSALKAENIIDVSNYSITQESADTIFTKLLADNPEFFWLTRKMTLSSINGKINRVFFYYTDGTTVDDIKLVDNTYKLTTSANRNTITANISNLNNKVKSIISSISPSLSQFEKEKIIHDYIIFNNRYDSSAASATYSDISNLPHAFDVYGCIINKCSVCEGYSKAFQYLCYQVGINATQVYGSSSGVGHMWNTANIDGSWYVVDVTFDDIAQDGMSYYGYFNTTTQEITSDHIVSSEQVKAPYCTETEYSYKNRCVVKITNTSSAIQQSAFKNMIDTSVKNKDGYIILYFDGCTMTSEYLVDNFISPSGPVSKYISQKGYIITFTGKCFVSGNFVYLQVK